VGWSFGGGSWLGAVRMITRPSMIPAGSNAPTIQTLGPSLVNTAVAANYLGLSESTLNKWRLTGDGPRYFKFGRAVRYRIADLDDWAEQHRAISTAGIGR
jgi:predicted DNA-binding transcriptional regulator AlpA